MKAIVVGYDGTEPATRALERAADLASAFRSRVVVTSVAPVLVGAGHGIGPVDPSDSPDDHGRMLDEARDVLVSRGVEAEYRPAIGQPAEAIVEVAEEAEADLIVVGTHEPSIFERLVGASVSAGVSRRAHCDVLIVH